MLMETKIKRVFENASANWIYIDKIETLHNPIRKNWAPEGKTGDTNFN